MKLSELSAYAYEKYQIQELHKWKEFPGFSVLCHPQTGKWIALFMRQWNSDTGSQIERCDLKCSQDSLIEFQKSYLTLPIRMKGRNWIDIIFDENTEHDIVFQLFDKAVALSNNQGYTVVLSNPSNSGYKETPLPTRNTITRTDRIRNMQKMYKYDRDFTKGRAENFYRQAVYMEDYEDNVVWEGEFDCYFPTYHQLSIPKLRGYFSWRTQIRKGIFQPIPTSAAYIYIFELLNDIGVTSSLDALKKMKEFDEGFIQSGTADTSMKYNLHRWMLEYAVLKNVPTHITSQFVDPSLMAWDKALMVLQSPQNYEDKEIFDALCIWGGKKLEKSPIIKDPEQGMHLIAEVWKASLSYNQYGTYLFTLCFGERKVRRWHPLSNAVYYEQNKPEDREYILDACRSYQCKNGIWEVSAYERLNVDKLRIQEWIHAVDARLRRYLKTGRYLREKEEESWVNPYVDVIIEADQKAILEASRPKIHIDMRSLDKIRSDSLITRDSLLIEEEIEEEIPDPVIEETDLPIDKIYYQILLLLLKEEDPSELIKDNHLMPSIVADAINEALFDEFGDTVILCENDTLILVEDYIEDLKEYLGG